LQYTGALQNIATSKPMALKASIFKVNLDISDMDRHYYQSHALTLARHPSETDLRMMVRVVAFALNAHEELAFTKGLSTQDEPDLWNKSLSDEIELWVDLGQPDEKRIRQACGKAKQVVIYGYQGRQAGPWFKQVEPSLNRFDNLRVIQFPSEQAESLAQMVSKNMSLQISIQDGEVFISNEDTQTTVTPEQLFPVQ